VATLQVLMPQTQVQLFHNGGGKGGDARSPMVPEMRGLVPGGGGGGVYRTLYFKWRKWSHRQLKIIRRNKEINVLGNAITIPQRRYNPTSDNTDLGP
jgi:hypothetical protein